MLRLNAHLFAGRLLGRRRAATALERANRAEAEHGSTAVEAHRAGKSDPRQTRAQRGDITRPQPFKLQPSGGNLSTLRLTEGRQL